MYLYKLMQGHNSLSMFVNNSTDRKSKGGKGRHRTLSITSVILLILLIFAMVRVSSAASNLNDQFMLQIGNQESALVDLRQSLPISPYLFGTNVFPEIGTNSVDRDFTGFMYYSPPIANGLQSAHIKLLRFPGGNWGESQDHILSLDQLNAFSTLLSQVGAEGMISARLSSPVDGTGRIADLATRANLAGRWVDYMNNPRSDLRTGKYAHAPFHPIKFWSVGNEPDRLIDKATNKAYTVADYVREFIQYSLVMHQNNPTIQVFGPEISQFYGIGAGPTDADGQLWMEGFLKGVGAYEHAHPELKFHLLDGVSFHRYQFPDARNIPNILLSSPDEWNYMLPQLRQVIRQDLGRDVPIAVTEVNTNPTNDVPTRGMAALWWADTLGTLMNQQVDYAAFFSTEGVDTPYPLFTTDGLHQTAMYRVMQLFSHLQNNLIPLYIQHEPVSVYATQDDSHSTVSLLFINKSDSTQLAQVSPQSSFFNTSSWHSLNISILGYSIVLVTLHRTAGAEAYSYTVPTTNSDAINPVRYTVCGNKVDALANEIPC